MRKSKEIKLRRTCESSAQSSGAGHLPLVAQEAKAPRRRAGSDSSGGGLYDPYTQGGLASPAAFRDWHREREAIIRRQVSIGNATCAFVASMLGYNAYLEKPTRKQLFDDARALIKAVRDGEPSDFPAVAHDCAAMIASDDFAASSYEPRRAAVEKIMEQAAAKLPVAEWVESVRGFSLLQLAQIVGMGVDFTRTVSACWKFVGLAVIDGERQRRVSGDAALEHKYDARKRSTMWNIAQTVFKSQSAMTRKDGTVKPAGPFRVIYDERRIHTATTHPEWSKGHSHNDAVRFMTKRLFRCLWQTWRAATFGEMPNDPKPSATETTPAARESQRAQSTSAVGADITR